MKPKLIILMILLVFILSATCSTLKRYNSVQTSGYDNTLAAIDLFGFRLSQANPENGSKSLWDLSADAQAQFIKILNARYPDNDKFKESLSFEYLKGGEEFLPEDYVSKNLRLIFSVSKRRDYIRDQSSPGLILSAADRIEYLKITLKIPEDTHLRFTGWNMYTTEYGSVDIADISFSRSLELDASAFQSSKTDDSGVELSAGGGSSVNRKENQAIKYRYLKLNGRINNNGIEMEEEGIREIDLTGNVTADVSLEFDRYPEILTGIIGLKDSTGRFNEPDRLTIRYTDVVIPMMEEIMDTIYAELRMDYIFRNVLNGSRTFPEWDDRIKYYTGSVTKTIPLFSAHDYVPHFYCIGNDNGADKRDVIKIASSENKVYSMIFRTSSEASAFYDWIIHYIRKTENKAKVVKIGGQTLKFMDSDLTGNLIEDYSRFRIIPYYR
jgi:hypothetical protein